MQGFTQGIGSKVKGTYKFGLVKHITNIALDYFPSPIYIPNSMFDAV